MARNHFPQQYELDQNKQKFSALTQVLKTNYEKAKTIKDKNELLLTDCRYAYFYNNPNAATIKKLGFRYREFHRKMGGNVPEHVIDAVIKSDVRYVGLVTKLSEEQQIYVASQNPWMAYAWSGLFQPAVLNKISDKFSIYIELLGQLGLTGEAFNTTFSDIVSGKVDENTVAKPLVEVGINF